MFKLAGSKVLVLLGSLLLTLSVTGGLFAYTYTTRSTTIDVTVAPADFGSVSVNSTPTAIGTLVGRARGAISSDTLFDISTDSNYTGDVEVQVSLANVDELTEAFSFFIMRLALTDNTTLINRDMEGITQVLSLDSPVVSFAIDSDNLSEAVYVQCEGGSYRTWPFVLGSSGSNPLIFCQILQADAH